MPELKLNFTDCMLQVGRTNNPVKDAPVTEEDALRVMQRYDVTEAMVYHVLSRDGGTDIGNEAISNYRSEKIHRIFGFDTAAIAPVKPADFLKKSLQQGAKAFLVNPAREEIFLCRSNRLKELAGLLQERKIPLYIIHGACAGGAGKVNWADLTDFCNEFSKLPVIVWHSRMRENRPVFDALENTDNLRIALSSLWQAQMVKAIVENFGAERILFSMGIPQTVPSTFQAVVTYAGISDGSKKAIAFMNINNLISEANYEC